MLPSTLFVVFPPLNFPLILSVEFLSDSLSFPQMASVTFLSAVSVPQVVFSFTLRCARFISFVYFILDQI